MDTLGPRSDESSRASTTQYSAKDDSDMFDISALSLQDKPSSSSDVSTVNNSTKAPVKESFVQGITKEIKRDQTGSRTRLPTAESALNLLDWIREALSNLEISHSGYSQTAPHKTSNPTSSPVSLQRPRKRVSKLRPSCRISFAIAFVSDSVLRKEYCVFRKIIPSVYYFQRYVCFSMLSKRKN